MLVGQQTKIQILDEYQSCYVDLEYDQILLVITIDLSFN